MNYVDEVASNLYYEFARVDPEVLDAPELFEMYTLLAFVKGKATTLKDVHDAWAVWKNRTNHKHKSLIPFEELTLEVQELDRKYMECIHNASK